MPDFRQSLAAPQDSSAEDGHSYLSLCLPLLPLFFFSWNPQLYTACRDLLRRVARFLVRKSSGKAAFRSESLGSSGRLMLASGLCKQLPASPVPCLLWLFSLATETDILVPSIQISTSTQQVCPAEMDGQSPIPQPSYVPHAL